MIMQNHLNAYSLLSFSKAVKKTVTESKEFLNIGPTPHDEDCTQAGENTKDSILECMVYIGQLVRTFGEPPKGCEFFVMRNEHEVGSYYDVNIFYNIPFEEEECPGLQSSSILYEHNEEEELWRQCEEYALKVESGVDTWDDIALQELKRGEHHLHTAKIVDMKKTA